MSGETARDVRAQARPVDRNDAQPLSEMLGRAFFDDPVMEFLIQDAAVRRAKLPRLFRLFLRLGMPYGACDVTPGYEAAALWRPPGCWHMPFFQYIINGPDLLGIFGLRDALRAMSVMDVVEKQHAKEPHFYLQVLGTDPAKQGKGFGGIAIRRHLAIADAARMPCYLESSKVSNIPIYQSFGFELTGEIKLPGGPSVYPMWRKARLD